MYFSTNKIGNQHRPHPTMIIKHINKKKHYIKNKTTLKGCKCPVEGHELVCIDLGCGKTMMKTPNVPYPRNMDLRSSFYSY